MADIELEALVERVRNANPIDAVIGETVTLRRSGRALVAQDDHSLVVYPGTQTYVQFGRGKRGETADARAHDVFEWVMQRDHVEFWDALTTLARRGNVTMPEFGQANRAAVLAARVRADVLAECIAWSQSRFAQSPLARQFAQGRGWHEKFTGAVTILDGGDKAGPGMGLGFTGASWDERNSLRDWVSKAGLPTDHPAVVAFVGYTGDVRQWWEKWRGQLHGDCPPEWMQAGKISGLPIDHIIYPYFEHGRVVQAKARSIDPACPKHERMRNLKEMLVGPKRPYCNFEYGPRVDGVVFVEGEGDACTVGTWGHPAVAIGEKSAHGAAAGAALELLPKGATAYVGFSNDYWGIDQMPEGDERAKAERNAAHTLEQMLQFAERISPRARIIIWPEHDANDWHKAAQPDAKAVRDLLRAAPTLVEYLAARVEGAEDRDAAIRRAFRQIAKLDKHDLEIRRPELAAAMGLKSQQFAGLLKATRNETDAEAKQQAEAAEEEQLPEVTVSNPTMVDDHFLEVLYDLHFDRHMLAVRYPDGRLDARESIDIGNVRYSPELLPHVYAAARKRSNPMEPPPLLMPNRLPNGAALSVAALHEMIMDFTTRYVDVPEEHRRIACYYVILTWVYDAFRDIGFMRAMGPTGKGKSRYVATFGVLCYRALSMAGLTTLSPLFRMKASTPCTLLMDEINSPHIEAPGELELYFNLGMSVNSPPLWRSEGKDAVPTAFSGAYGPRFFGAIKPFRDPATNNRCITVEMTIPTSRTDIQELDERFYRDAQDLRNHLMQFRMTHWRPNWEVKRELLDQTVEPRLRQITAPLVTIIQDDGTRNELLRVIRQQNADMVGDRGQTVAAKIVRALAIITREPAKQDKVGNSRWDTRCGRIYDMVRDWVFDEEEAPPAHKDNGERNADSPRNDPKHWVNRMSARRIGEISRRELALRTEEATWLPNKPRVIVVTQHDLPRLTQLRKLYGVDEDATTTAQPPLAPSQPISDQPAPAAPPPPDTWSGDDDYFAGLAD